MALLSPSSPARQPDLSIRRFFARLEDPRRAHRRLHPLQDIIVVALCAVIAGAQDWQQMVTFGRNRLDWLRGFLELPHGIPSHDTFERVFDRLKPQAFQACFRDWVHAISAALPVKHIAIDGKTLRGSGSAKLGPLRLVSAWASAQHLSLGQVAVDAKSNEITAIPALLELLELNGALVTIDAMGCQKAIAQQIVDQGGHYALVVMNNQEHLLEDIRQIFREAFDSAFAGLDYDVYRTSERGDTMVANPYVNHVPVLAGGIGRRQLDHFYGEYFIPGMPPDVELVPISRTVGQNPIVDEFVCRCTHTVRMDWLLLGVPPTGRPLELVTVVIVCFESGKIHHEHIHWDQASALVQLGLLDRLASRWPGPSLPARRSSRGRSRPIC